MLSTSRLAYNLFATSATIVQREQSLGVWLGAKLA
jgi:hypothetical protein